MIIHQYQFLYMSLGHDTCISFPFNHDKKMKIKLFSERKKKDPGQKHCIFKFVEITEACFSVPNVNSKWALEQQIGFIQQNWCKDTLNNLLLTFWSNT